MIMVTIGWFMYVAMITGMSMNKGEDGLNVKMVIMIDGSFLLLTFLSRYFVSSKILSLR